MPDEAGFRALVIQPSGLCASTVLYDWQALCLALSSADVTVNRIPIYHGLAAYTDEDGFSKRLPHNPLATRLIRSLLVLAGDDFYPGNIILGPVVICADKHTPNDIEQADVPEWVVRMCKEGKRRLLEMLNAT